MTFPVGTRVVKWRACNGTRDTLPVGTIGTVVDDGKHGFLCKKIDCMLVDTGDGGRPWHTEAAAWRRLDEPPTPGDWGEVERETGWNPYKEKVYGS